MSYDKQLPFKQEFFPPGVKYSDDYESDEDSIVNRISIDLKNEQRLPIKNDKVSWTYYIIILFNVVA